MRQQFFNVGRTVVRRWWVQLTALLVVFVFLWGAPDSPRAASPLISPPLYSASMNSGVANQGWQLPSCGSFDTAPYHTVPGVEISFSLNKASVLDLSFAGLGRNSSNGSIYSAFFVNGQKINTAFGHEQLGGRRQGDVGGQWVWHSLANTIAVPVSAGTHTVAVKVKCDSASSQAYVWNGWLNVGVYDQNAPALTPTPSNTATRTPTRTATRTPTATNTPTVTPTAPPAGEVSLVLSPAEVTSSVGQSFDLPIIVEAGSQSVDGASAYLNFDPSLLQVVSIAPGNELSFELQNSFDNNSGQVDFAAGSFSGSTGTFTLATVTFEAIAESDGTAITFNSISPRQSDVTFSGTSVLDQAVGSTVMIYNAMLSCSVELQGRPQPPHASWSVPLNVSLTVPGESVPAYTFTPTTDENGDFTIVGVAPGEYELRVKHEHTLQNMIAITLEGSNSFDCGLLREGDADNNNVVNIIDFSILAATFGRCDGMAGYDSRADFDENNCISIIDFSLLAANFGQVGASPWPWPTSLLQPPAPEEVNRTTGEVQMLVDPASTRVQAGDLFQVAVELQTGSQKIDGAQVTLNFDPELLAVEQVTAGSDLPFELQSLFDNEKGTLNFAAGILPEEGTEEDFPAGSLTLLQIEFRALAEAEETALALQVDSLNKSEANDTLPSDVTFGGTSLLAEQIDGSVRITNAPTSITLDGLSATSQSFSWLLAALIGFTMLAGMWFVRKTR